MPKMLIIADDLTGATDSAATCAEYGMETIVLLGDPPGDIAVPETAEALAIDANTRCLHAEDAAEITARIIRDYGASADRALLFKKVDSTLRGHLAAELAAALNARRAQVSSDQRVVVVLAPAFPAQGRTTVRGRQMMRGKLLEDADSWPGEFVRGHSNIAEIMGEAGLICGLTELKTVRSGQQSLERAMFRLANTVDVIVCDAENEEDLQAIAASSMALGPKTVWAGSAGLARHMPCAAGVARASRSSDLAVRNHVIMPGPALFVVGSPARASREQARALAAAPNMETLTIQLSLLNDQSSRWRELARDVARTLQLGRDVLLTLEFSGQDGVKQPNQVARIIARIVKPCTDHVGALVATGGETARTVLDAWGVRRLRLLGEVEPGLPYSMTDQWSRDILVLTKAGGFGTPNTLLHCRNFIWTTEHNRRGIAEHDTVVENRKN